MWRVITIVGAFAVGYYTGRNYDIVFNKRSKEQTK